MTCCFSATAEFHVAVRKKASYIGAYFSSVKSIHNLQNALLAVVSCAEDHRVEVRSSAAVQLASRTVNKLCVDGNTSAVYLLVSLAWSSSGEVWCHAESVSARCLDSTNVLVCPVSTAV